MEQLRRDRVLDAAAKLIAWYGYDKTTVNDIAEYAGFTKATVYLDFSGKEELFTVLLRRQMGRILDDVSTRVHADARGGAIGMIYQHALLSLAADPLMRALYTQDSHVLGQWARRQPRQRYADRFIFGRMFVARMQQAGLIRPDLDVDAATSLLSALSLGLLELSEHTGRQALPLEDLSAPLAEVVQRGFGAAGGDNAVGKNALQTLLADLHRQYEEEGDGTGAFDSR